MNDEQLELANGYLDGEVTADERAQVESDPGLLAEVERLRLVRSAIAAPIAPSVDARERAIAAALVAFDEAPGRDASVTESTPSAVTRVSIVRPGDPTAPTNVIPFDRRRRVRWIQGLSAAAAAAIVVVAAGVVLTQGDDDDQIARNQDEATPTSVVPATAATGLAPATLGEAAATGIAPATLDEAATDPVPTAEAFESVDATASTPLAADEAAPSSPQNIELDAAAPMIQAAVPSTSPGVPAAAPSATMMGGAVPTTTADEPIVLRSSQDLLDLAASMTVDPPVVDQTDEACDDRLLKTEALYEDHDGTRHPIVVVLTDGVGGHRLGALSLDDCVIVLRAESGS